jgi:hypothetical protein
MLTLRRRNDTPEWPKSCVNHGLLGLLLLLLSGCGGGPRLQPGGTLGQSFSLECAPYARAVTGIQLSGEAAWWWDEAAGRYYPRVQQPQPGSVLVFRRSPA